jgi:hypothetical protein
LFAVLHYAPRQFNVDAHAAQVLLGAGWTNECLSFLSLYYLSGIFYLPSEVSICELMKSNERDE